MLLVVRPKGGVWRWGAGKAGIHVLFLPSPDSGFHMVCYPLLQCGKCLVRRKEALGAFWPVGLPDTEGQVRKKY